MPRNNPRLPADEAAVPVAHIELWVTAGRSAESIAWDPWRRCWAVSCRAPPTQGRANRAVARFLAGCLGLPLESVRWIRAGASRSKVLEAQGITQVEADRRLGAHAAGSPL
jgi:uncharacterized protein YggU (UPF0235/DUF167 family)